MATRQEMFAKLRKLKPVVDPILDVAYRIEEEITWREDLFSSPHGEHWHTSFHASSFPGDDPKACGRQAIYSLMNIPAMEPIDRSGRAVMEAGKDIEVNVVNRLFRGGITLTGDPRNEHQMGFTDAEHWLTGSPDTIINTPHLNRPHPIEIKTKDQEVVEKMQAGQKSFDAPHRRQVLTYIGLTHENSKELWPELDECSDGTILYISRDRPGNAHEYRFQYDKGFMDEGRSKLKSWKEDFIRGILPPRPKEWRWTEQPCKYCPVKKVCKEDYKAGITKLSESHTIAHAESVRGEYNYEQTRQEVLDRWDEGGEE